MGNLYFEKADDTMTQEIVDVVFQTLKEFKIETKPKAKPEAEPKAEAEAAGAEIELFSVEENYFKQAGYFEVLKDSDQSHKIVATWGILPTTFDTCELRKMYMNKSYRGQGYGRLMVERAINWAKENQFKFIVLETTAPLTAAIKLYEKMGFIRVIGEKNASACCELFYRLTL